MSLHLRDGRLTIDQDGRTVFDTEDKLYHNITTDGLSGIYTAQQRSVGNQDIINIDNNYLVGTCNQFCTHVCGSVKFGGTDRFSLPPNIWFAYEGGDIFWTVDYHTGFASPFFTIYPTGIVKYRFFVNAGQVILNERVFFTSGINLIIPGHSIIWKLKAGRFT
jgi:hypothetical protein